MMHHGVSFVHLIAMLLPFLAIAGTAGLLLFRNNRIEGSKRPSEHGQRAELGSDSPAPSSIPENSGSSRPNGELDSLVFRLAARNSGVLTVSQVVAESGLSVHAAEEVLNGLVDGTRVRLEVSDSGRTYYEFPELMEGNDPQTG